MMKLPTPRVQVINDSTRHYSFGSGITGRIERYADRFDWELQSIDGTHLHDGSSIRGDNAFLNLWCRAALYQSLDPLSISCSELDELADQADRESVLEVAKIYRRILKQRTGTSWSVRVGRGSERDSITIMSSDRARTDTGKMTAHDSALLAALTQVEFVNPSSGVMISKRSRRSMVYTLAGAERPQAARLAVV